MRKPIPNQQIDGKSTVADTSFLPRIPNIRGRSINREPSASSATMLSSALARGFSRGRSLVRKSERINDPSPSSRDGRPYIRNFARVYSSSSTDRIKKSNRSRSLISRSLNGKGHDDAMPSTVNSTNSTFEIYSSCAELV